MSKQYLYLSHSGVVFYLCDRQLEERECLCPWCKQSDLLWGAYEQKMALNKVLVNLSQERYDIIPGKNYHRLIEKYCPDVYCFG